MTTSVEPNLELSTRIVHSFSDVPGAMMTSWSRILACLYEKTLSVSYLRRLEITAAAKAFRSEAEAHAGLASVSVQDQLSVLAALSLLRDEAESGKDILTGHQISQFIEAHLNRSMAIQHKDFHFQSVLTSFRNQFESYNNKTVISIQVSLASIITDYALRWLTLVMITILGLGSSYITPANILIVPVITYLIFYLKSISDKKHNFLLLDKYALTGTTIVKYKYSALFYSMAILFVSSGIYIDTLLFQTATVQVHFITFAGLALHYFFLSRVFPTGRLSESELLLQVEAKQNHASQEFDYDENDSAIVYLESRFNAMNSRLEAFVLESALFGALSFSGFLQIMSTDLVSFVDLEKFAQLVFEASKAVVSFDQVAYGTAATQLDTKEYLFCLVSVETLLCSVFFLAVIAVRLRFSNVADKVSSSINSAKAFNEKEELLIDLQDTGNQKTSLRLATITKRVNEEIRSGNKAIKTFNPVVNYMQYFRNAGIFTFLIILITSAMLVTGVLVWLFLLLGFASILYFNSSAIGEVGKILFLRFQVSFTRNNLRFLALAVLPFIVGFVGRLLLHVRTTDWLIALGFILLGFYLSCWLILLPHFDLRYGDIENTDGVARSRWSIINFTLGISVATSFIGLAADFLSGRASSFVLVSFTGLVVIVMVATIFLSKKIWLGVLLGFLFSGVVFALLFKILHLVGSIEMMILATVFIVIAVLTWVAFRQHCHDILFRILLFLLLVDIMIVGLPNESYLDWRLVDRLTIMYEHESLQTDRIFRLEGLSFDATPDDPITTSKFLEEAEWYASWVGTDYGFTSVYSSMVRNSNWAALVWYQTAITKGDSSKISNALSLARYANKTLAKFDYAPEFADARLDEPYTLLADILVWQGKTSEALDQLRAMLKTSLPEYRRAFIKEKIDFIERETNTLN